MSDTAIYVLAGAVVFHALSQAFVGGAVARLFYYNVRKALIEAAHEVRRWKDAP